MSGGRIHQGAAVLVFIGPSGAGKSSVVRELVARGVIEFHPSWTDRAPRTEELATGGSHRFVSPGEFSHLQEEGYFLEVVQPFGLPFRYGLPPLESSGGIPTIMVRAAMLGLVARHYPAHTVYQIECSVELARFRLSHRQDGSSLGSRLEDFEKEVQLGRTLADRTFRNDSEFQSTVGEVLEALERDFG